MRSVAFFALIVGCTTSSDDPCKGVQGACVGVAAGASTETIQTALIQVTAGGTVR